MTSYFGPRTDITSLDESFDEFPLLGPPVSPKDELKSFGDSEVARK
jgi:hypothetical protein